MWSRCLQLLPRLRLAPAVVRLPPLLPPPLVSARPFTIGAPAFKKLKTLDYTFEENEHLYAPETSLAPVAETSHLPDERPSQSETGLTDAQQSRRTSLPTSTKKLNKLLGSYKRYELKESDLEETFVRGMGPGGQVINKSSICVSLVHKPTNLRVRCQETRSQEQNRKIARKLMAEKLATLDPESQTASRTEILAAKARLKRARQAKRSSRKYKTAELDKSENSIERIAGAVGGAADSFEDAGDDEQGLDLLVPRRFDQADTSDASLAEVEDAAVIEGARRGASQ